MRDDEAINISTSITMLFIALADELEKEKVISCSKVADKIELFSSLPASANPQAQTIYASVVRALRMSNAERESLLIH